MRRKIYIIERKKTWPESLVPCTKQPRGTTTTVAHCRQCEDFLDEALSWATKESWIVCSFLPVKRVFAKLIGR